MKSLINLIAAICPSQLYDLPYFDIFNFETSSEIRMT